MNIDFLSEYAAPVIVGICLCIGYILKNLVPAEKVNRYIPLIMGILGVVLNVWINRAFTPEILLMGLFSGLASTGLHQVFKGMLAKE
ncbi:MAG: phage holin family protein [Lachnospiraceae bacterium]|nr:phage holin family protein [Lachnospiraceae bacterium]MDY4968692.1 phage holin family protein [Lachnospiraceae bacterium]